MRSGGDRAAITVVGRIASHVYELEDEPDKFLRYRVSVTYDELVDPPITREEMRNDPDEALRTYNPYVLGLNPTNFLLPPPVAQRTAELVRTRTRPIGPSAGAWNRRVFISHSHEDDEFVQRLAGHLQHALGGVDYAWYDSAPHGLKGGEEWWDKIRRQLETRPVFVVVLSLASMRSKWVNDEINMAWSMRHSRRLRVIPVLYKPCDIRSDLQSIQYISFLENRPYNAALNDLVNTINMTDRDSL